MFGKLFNTLQATINMESTPGSTGPGFSSSAPSSTSGPSLPSLSDFGLGSLTGVLSGATQRPRAPAPTTQMPPMSGAPRPPAPRPGGPPDVDLSGLSEEEKTMIQSVMMRAQESEGAKQQQQQQQPTGLGPRPQVPSSQAFPMAQVGMRPPGVDPLRPPGSMPQQFQQPQQQQQLLQQQQQQQRPQQPSMYPQQQQQQQMPQQVRPPQQQPGATMYPQQQQQQPATSIYSQQQQSQPLGSSQTMAMSTSQQLSQMQQQPEYTQSTIRPGFPTSESSFNQQQQQPYTSISSTVSGVQSSLLEQKTSMSQSFIPSSLPAQQPPTSMGLQQQIPMGQNLETLQQQAQPTVMPTSALDPLRMPSSTTQITSQPSVISSMIRTATPQTTVISQTFPSVSFPSSTISTSSVTSAQPFVMSSTTATSLSSQLPQQQLQQQQQLGMAASLSSTMPNTSYLPRFTPSSVMVPTPLVLASQQQPLMATGPVDSPLRRMVHQQSWSEGKFDAALSGLGGPMMDPTLMQHPQHPMAQLNRRRSMDQITGLPQDYGMNAVLEPLDVKLPPTTMTAVGRSSRVEAASSGIPSSSSSSSTAISSSTPSSSYTSAQRHESGLFDTITSTVANEKPPSREYTVSPPLPVPSSTSQSLVSSNVLVGDAPPVVESSVFSVDSILPNQILQTKVVDVVDVVDVPPLLTEHDVTPLPVEPEPEPEPVLQPISEPPEPEPKLKSPESPPKHESQSEPLVVPTSPPVACKLTPPESYVNPFSTLLKSFDEDRDDNEVDVEVNDKSLPKEVLVEPSVPSPTTPVGVVSSDVVVASSLSPTATSTVTTLTDTTSNLINESGTDGGIGPKSWENFAPSDNFLSVRRGSGERRASLGALLPTTTSGTSATSTNFKSRSGAVLPSIPGKALPDRFVTRTGSLSEQQFIEQLKATKAALAAAENQSPVREPSGLQRLTKHELIEDSLNYDIDEEYEREEGYVIEEEDEDDMAIVEDASPLDVYTIPEESEEDLMSPKSTDQSQIKKTLPQTQQQPLPALQNHQSLQQPKIVTTSTPSTSAVTTTTTAAATPSKDPRGPMSQQHQQQIQQQQMQQQMMSSQRMMMTGVTQGMGQQQFTPTVSQGISRPLSQGTAMNAPSIPLTTVSQAGVQRALPMQDQYSTPQTSIYNQQQPQVPPSSVATTVYQQQFVRGPRPLGPQDVGVNVMQPEVSSSQSFMMGQGMPPQQQQRFPVSQPSHLQQQQPVISQAQQIPGPRPQGPLSTQQQQQPTQLHHQRYPQSQQNIPSHPSQQQHPLHRQQQLPPHSQGMNIYPTSHQSNLMPPGSKRMPNIPQEYWGENEGILSPIQDVSPSVEAAEQKSMEMMKKHPTSSTIGHQHHAPREQIPLSEQMMTSVGMTRASSGTISGMIADFNKQMQALNTEEESLSQRFNQIAHGRKLSPKHAKYPSSMTQNIPLKPDMVGLEKVVSPVIERSLLQQQLLLHQQQALIELQKDQQEIQKSLQEQLKLQTLQTQMQIEQQNKTQAAAAPQPQPPPQPTVIRKEVVSTGTSISIPSTPKTESRDWRSDSREQRTERNRVRSPERLRDRRDHDRRRETDNRREIDSRREIDNRREIDSRRDERGHEHDSKYRRSPRRDEDDRTSTHRAREYREHDRDRTPEYVRDRTPERRERSPEYTRPRPPYNDRRPQHPQQQQQQQQQQQPYYQRILRDEVPERTRTTTSGIATGGLGGKKDRRRLPQPTVEEIQGAVDAISGNTLSNSLPSLGYRGASSLSASHGILRTSSPPTLGMRPVTSTGLSIPNAFQGTSTSPLKMQSASSTVPVGSSVLQSVAVITDHRSLSPGLLIASYPVQVVSPSTLSRAFSPPLNDTASDSASDLLKKARRLPLAPAQEIPFTTADASKRLAEEKNKFSSSLTSTHAALRPSSSLDSATSNLFRTTSGLADRISPYAGLSDVANILNAPSSLSVAPPLSTTLQAGKATTGSLLDQIIKSPSRGPGGILPVPGAREGSTSPYLTSLKSLKDQLKHELKSSVLENSRRAALFDSHLYPRSESDLQALFDIYNVPDVLVPSSSTFSRMHRRNASDSALFSPIQEDVPPGYYRSHGYDRFLDRDLRRPLSSLGGALLDPLLRPHSRTSGVGLLAGLSSEYEDVLTDTLRYPRRRSEGSIDLDNLSYALDSYGRPVLCESDIKESLKSVRRKKRGVPSTSVPISSTSRKNFFVTDEHLTREEKAARIKAEIARRREQMINSELEAIEQEELLDMEGGFYEDEYGNIVYPEDLIEYEDELAYSDLRGRSRRGLRGLRSSAPYLSRSWDAAYDDAYYDDLTYDEELYLNSRGGGLLPYDVDPLFMNVPSKRRLRDDQVLAARVSGRRSNQGMQYAGQTRSTCPRYPFPVKRILLTRDPKERPEHGNAFGMRVIGGKTIPNSNGMIGAFVAKILPGGVVDTLGEVKEGNQVMEWNGVPLTGKTHEEVQNIIRSTLGLEEVEVIIRADITQDINPEEAQFLHEQALIAEGNRLHQAQQQQQLQQQQQAYEMQQQQQQQSLSHQMSGLDDHMTAPPSTIFYPRGFYDDHGIVEDLKETTISAGAQTNIMKGITGDIQLQICYDMKAAILYVTVIKARNLRLVHGEPPDAFVKAYLLPPRLLENQRRTRYFSRTCDPEWKQTMLYNDIRREDLPKKSLEISVWSFNIYESHEFLGQVIIHLSENFIMDDDPVWYPLGGMDNVFRLNSELPHRRPPQSRVLRSAYRTEKGSLWPEPEGLTPGSITGFPARSPTTVYPGQSTMQKKFKFNISEKIQRAMDSKTTTGTSIFKPRPPFTRSNLFFAFHDTSKKSTTTT